MNVNFVLFYVSVITVKFKYYIVWFHAQSRMHEQVDVCLTKSNFPFNTNYNPPPLPRSPIRT